MRNNGTDLSNENKAVYLYETHLHTRPASECSHIGVKEALLFYKERGYEGVFITNHFLSGRCVMDNFPSYDELVNTFFADYEEAVDLSREVGISVFGGVELSLGQGTHFLVYGLGKEWFLAHPEIVELPEKKMLTLLYDAGAMIIHAHPFRESKNPSCIRLFPRFSGGVEINNGGNSDAENQMAKCYADHYCLPYFAGSDFHGRLRKCLYGVSTSVPVTDEQDFIRRVKNGEIECFTQQV